ncbi:MAG: hypothetical protein ABR609_12320 [Acidimicrobiia bacterium]
MSIDRSYEFSSPPAGERMVLRVGAACGVAGAVIAIAGNALHPRTSASEIGDTAAYLALVNGSENWVAVHAVIVFGSLLFLFTQFALSRSPMPTPGGHSAE